MNKIVTILTKLLSSRAVLGILALVVNRAFTGVDVSADSLADIGAKLLEFLQSAEGLFTAGAGALAVYGRVKAKGPITTAPTQSEHLSPEEFAAELLGATPLAPKPNRRK